MYTRLSELRNLVLAARDGEIGRCRDFLFDDEHWTVRYVEANTSRWLLGRRVLISPVSLQAPDLKDKRLPVNLTRAEIKSAPGLAEHQPVSRQYEAEFARHYRQSYYWAGGGIWGLGAYPVDILQSAEIQSPPEYAAQKTEDSKKAEDSKGDEEHLRSAEEVRGYRIRAIDDELGEIEDFVVDTATWTIVFAVLDTRRWLPGKTVMLPVSWAKDISWSERQFSVDVTRRAIETAPQMEEPISVEAVKAYLRHFGR